MDEQRGTRGLDRSIVRGRLDVEIGEVRAAMALVASGTASRVRLTGLRFGRQLLERLRDDADRDGLRLVEEPWADDAGCDLSVEASYESR
jgi:hypothetical protein